jgi:hypothetical protein
MHVKSNFVHLIAGGVLRRDNGRGMAVKWNYDGGWSSDDVIL